MLRYITRAGIIALCLAACLFMVEQALGQGQPGPGGGQRPGGGRRGDDRGRGKYPRRDITHLVRFQRAVNIRQPAVLVGRMTEKHVEGDMAGGV